MKLFVLINYYKLDSKIVINNQNFQNLLPILLIPILPNVSSIDYQFY